MGYFALLNQRKRSIVLDLKSDTVLEVLHRLLADADVLITNMRHQALSRLTILPASLVQRHPSLIVLSLTGFGLTNAGPDTNRGGLAPVAKALSGTTSLTRDREGRATWCGFALGEIIARMTAHSAILLAMRQRDLTGQGRLIDSRSMS